jgi:hypothetical protein
VVLLVRRCPLVVDVVDLSKPSPGIDRC